jgi:5-formyltetrahydrofolate cyclo-ligase
VAGAGKPLDGILPRVTGATPDAPATAKAALRRAVLARRDAAPAAARRAWSRAIAGRLAALPALSGAHLVLGYCSFGSEPETGAVLEAVLARGQALALPRVNRTARRLELRLVADPAGQLVPGTWGIREPDPARCPEVAPAAVDFVLVPGVAFDARGGRLGYGGGYYDRLLPALPGRTARVAAAFELQMVPAVPMETGDRRVDLVVTERAAYPGEDGTGWRSEAC